MQIIHSAAYLQIYLRIESGHLSTECLDRRHLPPCRTDLTKLCAQRGVLSDPAQERVLTSSLGTLLIAQPDPSL